MAKLLDDWRRKQEDLPGRSEAAAWSSSGR